MWFMSCGHEGDIKVMYGYIMVNYSNIWQYKGCIMVIVVI